MVRGDAGSESLIAGLNVDFAGLGEQGFEIGWTDDNLYVAANSSTGVLYGVYRLLEHIGFAWYSPGSTHVPDTQTDQILWTRIRQIPKVELRGFWLEGDISLPDDYAIWLARNGASRNEIRDAIEEHSGYDLRRRVADIRETNEIGFRAERELCDQLAPVIDGLRPLAGSTS